MARKRRNRKHEQGPGRPKIIIDPDVVKFKYLHSEDRMPRLTTCYMRAGDDWSKGFALGSFSESTITKKEGRRKAVIKARKALGQKRNGSKVRLDEAKKVLKAIFNNNMKENEPFFKSQFRPMLNSEEKEMLGFA